MSPHHPASSPAYQRYSHLRSSNSPGPPPAKDMQHHAVMTRPSQHWNESYTNNGYPPSECTDCSTECTDSVCSTVNEITSQCTDQCVVIACSDPEHGSPDCTDGHSYCDFVCDSTADCADCNGLDALLQCCEDYHSCYVDETRPTNVLQPLPQQTVGGQYPWDPSLTTIFCDCPELVKTHPATNATSPPKNTPPTVDNNHSQYSSYPSLSPSNTTYTPVPQSFSPIPQNQSSDSQVVQYSTSEGQPHQSHPSSSSSSDAMPLTCMWGNCQEHFSSLRDLIEHVNLTHLRNPTDASCSTDCGHAPSKEAYTHSLDEAIRLHCLWDNCTEHLEPQFIPKSPDGSLMEAVQLTLASHLFQDHLGLHNPTKSYLSNGSEDDRWFAELMASSQQEQDRREDIVVDNLTSNAESVEEAQEDNFDPNVVHEQEPAASPTTATTATATTPATTTISSPIMFIGEVQPTEGHTCRWEACGYMFATCHDLMAHMSVVHVGSGKPQYDCLWDGCTRNGKKGFSSKQKISRHLQSHTGYRPFQCQECLQNFSESATLQQHIRRHTQEKPYKCDFPGCGKSFAITGALTIHKRTHNGLKPFKCSYCGRGFAESSNLSKHLRTHTGERPYPCTEPGCGKAFARPDQLTRHMTVHRKQAVVTTVVV